MRFSLESSKSLHFSAIDVAATFEIDFREWTEHISMVNFTAKFEEALRWGFKVGWGGFQLLSRRYISEIVQNRAQVIINQFGFYSNLLVWRMGRL